MEQRERRDINKIVNKYVDVRYERGKRSNKNIFKISRYTVLCGGQIRDKGNKWKGLFKENLNMEVK